MTNTTALEIEASIPPINIWMDYRLEMEALCISSLANDHPIISRIYPEQRENHPQVLPPPLTPYDELKRYRVNPRTKFTTCITWISKRMLEEME